MPYERFSLGKKQNLFGAPESFPMDDLVQRGIAPPPEPIGTHPANAPLAMQNLLQRQQSPLSPQTSPFGPGGMLPRPTFDPSSVQQQELPSQGTNPTVSKPSVLDEYNKIIGARPDRTKLREMMEGAPRREDFKPNKLTRLGATLGGISAGFRDPSKGVELAQSMLDRPYNEASAEYDKKLRNVSALAGMESEDVQQRLQGFNLQRSDEKDTRDFDLRKQEFDAKMEEFKERGWVKGTDENTGEVVYTNHRFPGQAIRGPKLNESIKEKTDREAKIAKAQEDAAMARTKEATNRATEVERMKGESKKAIETMKLQGAMDKFKYAPMTESQQKAGLRDKLQGLGKMGINALDYLDYDEETGLYSIKPEGFSFFEQDPVEKATKDAQKAMVMSQLGNIIQQKPAGQAGQTSGGLGEDEVELLDAKTGKSVGAVKKSELAAALADKNPDGSAKYKQR
jgi:Tfp pilus assembly major pilin PilA